MADRWAGPFLWAVLGVALCCAAVWSLIDPSRALPTAVAGIALTALYAGNGWIGSLLEPAGIKVAYTPVGIAVADLSFISVTRAIVPIIGVLEDGAPMVLLVKPQFEAGRAEVSKGRGVITDPEVHDRVRTEVGEALLSAGCTVRSWIDSPILGGDGNREFLVHATWEGSVFPA